MNRALVLAMALAIGLPLAEAAEAQAMGGGFAVRAGSASGARADHHRGGDRRRPTSVQRWERSLERARARGNTTGREPWNSYSAMPRSSFARSHFAESRLPRSRLYSGSCWSRDCGSDGWRAPSAPVARPGPAAPTASSAVAAASPAFARPVVRRLDARPIARGAAEGASPPRAYAHRVWRGPTD
ncbi:hypothetical protein ACFODL_20100 [Phenylobacterium terrae]|uniref:Uncharacterized protein n=1 Tax=Phenylobacterium terrae TaxID=2665495 RepID=A0ABW4MZX4_9CAUL